MCTVTCGSREHGLELQEGTVAEQKIDPVCGTKVDVDWAAGRVDYEGETYYFCTPMCHRKFEEAPQRYLQANQ